MKKYSLKILVPVIVLAAIAIPLFITASAGTISISFPAKPASGQVGSPVDFSVKIDVKNADLLPIQSVELQVYNAAGDNSAIYSALPLPVDANQTEAQTFTSPDDGTFNVSGTSDNNWDNLAASSGTGYGYGYGSAYFRSASLIYKVDWVPPADWPAGTYKLRVIVHGEDSATVTSDDVPSFTLAGN